MTMKITISTAIRVANLITLEFNRHRGRPLAAMSSMISVQYRYQSTDIKALIAKYGPIIAPLFSPYQSLRLDLL